MVLSDCAVYDATLKYNEIPKSPRQASPTRARLPSAPVPNILFHICVSGCIRVPAVKRKTKFQYRARSAGYLYAIYHMYVVVIRTDTTSLERVRASYFHPPDRSLNVTLSLFHTFKYTSSFTIPHVIDQATPTPANPTLAQRYTDAAQWAIAHDAELGQLEQQSAIVWIKPESVHPACKPIRLTMPYKYSRLPYDTV